MANQCLFESIHGRYPECSGACKKGPDKYCEYYYVDECCEIIKQWKEECKIDSPVLTKKDHKRKRLIIYTIRPGIMIGYKGEKFYKYQELLRPIIENKFIDHNGRHKLEDNFIEFIECDDVI